jgi:hypothetical protein
VLSLSLDKMLSGVNALEIREFRPLSGYMDLRVGREEDGDVAAILYFFSGRNRPRFETVVRKNSRPAVFSAM